MRVKDEYKLTSYAEFMQTIRDPDISKIRDFTDNGKCRDCGNCCGNLIPLTFDDLQRIKRFIREHGIVPSRPRIQPGPFRKPTAHNLCPFLLESEGHRCAIYPVRPGICQKWTCHNPAGNQELKAWYLSVPDIKIVDMYMMFYPEETMKELKEVL